MRSLYSVKKAFQWVCLNWDERRSKNFLGNCKFQKHFGNRLTKSPTREIFVERSLLTADRGPPKDADVQLALRKVNTV